MPRTTQWCHVCGKNEDDDTVIYNPVWDAHFCQTCDMWLEKQCSDPECEYCVGRPEKPSEI